MNKNRTILIISFTIVLAMIFTIFDFLNPDLSYKEEYIIDEYKEKGIEFSTGLNKYGDIVFKSPYLAFNKLKSDYKDGILLIKFEYNLEDLSQDNYGLYMKFGCQVTTGTIQELEQAKFVCRALDIYENSFKDAFVVEDFWDELWEV